MLEKIVEAADIRSTDTVLELGSGYGALTSRLVPLVRHVVTCEIDPVLARETTKRIHSEGYKNIEMLSGDAMRVDLPRFDVCVSNLPYALSAPILFRLLQHRPLFRRLTMIVQREFADALIADPGERSFSRLSMNASIFCRTERVKRINGGCFYPVPPVESSLINIFPRNPPPVFDFAEFDALTKVCFLEKRRILRNVFERPAVQKQLEMNYKIYCSLNKVATSIKPFPVYLRDTLEESGLAELPAKYLSPDKLELLLSKFHERGLFFTRVTG